MAVYYLFQYNPSLPGVNAKIIDKIYAFKNAGIDIKGLVLRNDETIDLNFLPDNLFEKIYFREVASKNKLLKNRFLSPLNSALNNLMGVKQLYNQVLSKRKIDFLITRYGTCDYSTLWLLKKLKHKIIFESNTNELEQLKLKFKSIFSSPAWISYDYFNEKYLAPRALNYAASVVCVTDEIAAYQRKRISPEKLPIVTTISNGINVSSFSIAPAVKYNQQTVNLIMILGVDSPWHGLDKIVAAIEKNKANNINLFVVGNLNEQVASPNIRFTGQLNKNQITELINKENICAGVGTLALERKGIKEAAPLKVREYIARGLPVIYSYEDTDIDQDVDFREKYCVKLEYGIKEMDLADILLRLKKILEIQDYNLKIQQFAFEQIDVKVKAKQYKNLLDNLINLNHN
jgi:hypothetical protein